MHKNCALPKLNTRRLLYEKKGSETRKQQKEKTLLRKKNYDLEKYVFAFLRKPIKYFPILMYFKCS